MPLWQSAGRPEGSCLDARDRAPLDRDRLHRRRAAVFGLAGAPGRGPRYPPVWRRQSRRGERIARRWLEDRTAGRHPGRLEGGDPGWRGLQCIRGDGVGTGAGGVGARIRPRLLAIPGLSRRESDCHNLRRVDGVDDSLWAVRVGQFLGRILLHRIPGGLGGHAHHVRLATLPSDVAARSLCTDPWPGMAGSVADQRSRARCLGGECHSSGLETSDGSARAAAAEVEEHQGTAKRYKHTVSLLIYHSSPASAS